jgi:tetratricopeptide (TPR) repeat protein
MHARIQTVALLLLTLSASNALAAEIRAPLAPGEREARNVDRVAEQTQLQAISKLKSMIVKRRNTPQEPMLLSRLADLQHQRSALLFRITQGGAAPAKVTGISGVRGEEQSAYRASLREAIATLDDLLRRYPQDEAVPKALSLRGRAYEELGNKPQAALDYARLTREFPKADESPAAWMALAEFSIEKNKHEEALQHLERVIDLPESPFYPFALYKKAWSLFNLKRISDALATTEKHLGYYHEKIGKLRAEGTPEESLSSDIAFQENMLLDSALFYFEGLEKGTAGFEVTAALPRFRALNAGKAPTRVMGKVCLRFTKLLRSHDRSEDLEKWKRDLIEKEPKTPETVESLLSLYEHALNKKRTEEAVAISSDLAGLFPHQPKTASWTQARKALLDTAELIQKTLISAGKTARNHKLTQALATLYQNFTRIVDEEDPSTAKQVAQVHLNLGETLFAIQDYPGATAHYRWVVERALVKAGTPQAPEVKLVREAGLRALSSRYEELRSAQLIPKELAATALPKSDVALSQSEMVAWVQWIDEHTEFLKKNRLTHREGDFELLQFEAARLLYSKRAPHEAIRRLKVLLNENPQSRVTPGALALVLDTLTLSNQWEETYRFCQDTLKKSDWKEHTLRPLLRQVGGNAFEKLLESTWSESNFPKIIEMADKFQNEFNDHSMAQRVHLMSAKAALSLNQKTKAETELTAAINANSRTALASEAAGLYSDLLADFYDFSGSANEALRSARILTIGPNPAASNGPALSASERTQAMNALERAVRYAWILGDRPLLERMASDRTLCRGDAASICARAMELAKLTGKKSDVRGHPQANSLGVPPTSAQDQQLPVLKALALSQELAPTAENALVWGEQLKILIDHWAQVDPLIQLSYQGLLPSIVRASLSAQRARLLEKRPLAAEARAIKRRIEGMKALETQAGAVSNLPGSTNRVEALNELAELYWDFTQELQKLEVPRSLKGEERIAYEAMVREILVPFEEKAHDFRSKAFQMASDTGVGPETFQRISERYFKENPSLTKKLKALPEFITAQAKPVEALSATFLLSLTELAKPHKTAPGSSRFSENPGALAKELWLQFLQNDNRAGLAHLIRELQTKAFTSAHDQALLRVITLLKLNQESEALAELETSFAEFNPDEQLKVRNLLETHARRSFSKARLERAKSLVSKKIEIAGTSGN